MSPEHDREPVRLYADDPPRDFDTLYRQEYRPLLRLAWTLTGRRDLAEELVQEAMLTAHQRWSSIAGYDAPGAYVRRVLLNAVTSAARRRGAERRALARIRTRSDVREDPPPDDQVWHAVRALPTRQAQAVALHYLEDRSVEEIASLLEIAEGTVKSHLHRGRLALAEALIAQDGER